MKKTAVLAILFSLLSFGAFAQTQTGRIADKSFWVVNSLVIGTTIYDVESTYFALNKCGISCREANPIMRPVVEAGKPFLYAVRGSIDAAVIFSSYKMKKEGRKFWYILPVVVTAGYSIIGTNNIRIAIKF